MSIWFNFGRRKEEFQMSIVENDNPLVYIHVTGYSFPYQILRGEGHRKAEMITWEWKMKFDDGKVKRICLYANHNLRRHAFRSFIIDSVWREMPEDKLKLWGCGLYIDE